MPARRSSRRRSRGFSCSARYRTAACPSSQCLRRSLSEPNRVRGQPLPTAVSSYCDGEARLMSSGRRDPYASGSPPRGSRSSSPGYVSTGTTRPQGIDAPSRERCTGNVSRNRSAARSPCQVLGQGTPIRSAKINLPPSMPQPARLPGADCRPTVASLCCSHNTLFPVRLRLSSSSDRRPRAGSCSCC